MYRIIGGDQKQYGPISADDLYKWIAESRLNAQSLVQAEGETEWKPLSAFPEFADALAAKPPAIVDQKVIDVNGGREAALAKVKGPAIALIITASLGIAYYFINGIITLFASGGGGGAMFQRQMPADMPPQLKAFVEGMRGPLAGTINLVIALLNGLILFGAINLLRLRNRAFAMTAAIIAMLPCQCCCLLGLPFGIWALTVLNKPEVKSQFS
jgi:hypothetical protein